MIFHLMCLPCKEATWVWKNLGKISMQQKPSYLNNYYLGTICNVIDIIHSQKKSSTKSKTKKILLVCKSNLSFDFFS